ncbi:site-specific DNA-methyltransferase [Phocaeicola vulgatus]|jgi:adenine-specific DNA-methyltransferase|nr:site-specific DNA-methyltransferase [Phocaeicola vulgatus]MDB1009836.1 site-specific DNA-methyltransferase [Phocaeicola vulgatus]MDB1014563.1 site-specific DNA-methyltransferase [Phocaeicola vulgatus]MDC1629726.1 site-specific DNA-methyltransferase [Phocaeicola vulgatus]MDC1663094.1 site-specific DNA-methyltransferase [Phocaeicola vulgatus]
MDKLRMQTLDGVQDNIDKIAALFPNCITERKDAEGKVTLAIDFDKLRQELSSEIVEGREERYQFTWPDKKKAILLANSPINATLRPCREESVDFDNTQNLYIEGDNLDVLKCLKETYLGKVKMIYIDPPYNTGNDFVYEDNFAESTSEYLANSGQYDEQGNRLVTNSENNGRFHTDWLNMIYPRLKVARDLLTDDGVIFISIDDNEVENLRKVCDEVFGEDNFVAQLVWERAFSPKNDAKYISNSHDYIMMYSRQINEFIIGRLDRTEEANARYSNPDNDPRGVWMSSDISVKTYNAACDYPITTPSGKIIEPPAGRCWSLSPKAFGERLQDNRIWFGPNGDNTPRIKRFLSELKFEGMAPTSILFYKDVGHSQEGAQEVVSLFGDKGVFDGPKPVRLLQRLITLANLQENSIVMDFFSGSATTAHALMKTNAEKGTYNKFILVQLNEEVSEKKKNVDYKTICEIGKERIRRAGKKIKEELASKQQENGLFTEQEGKQTLDIGFRVLKLDSSNMQDIYYSPTEYNQNDLFSKTESVKSDRTSEDLLFQVMLELGATLDSKIEQIEIKGKTIYNVATNYLVACFDNEIDDSVVTAIAKMQPQYAVFRDSSMADDSTATNFEQIFKTYSPNTTTKVL